MPAVNEVKIRILVDGKEIDISLDQLKAKINETGVTGQKAGAGIGTGMKAAYLGIMAGIAAVAGLTAVLVKAVDTASDFNEESSKFAVVFGEAGAKAEEFREKLEKSYSMSRLESTRLLASTGDLLTGFGATRDEAAKLSFQVQTMAADLVSFKNIEGGVKAASEALTKALLGERESAKMLGIAIQEEDVKQELNRMHKDKLEGSALKLAKAQATLNLIYRSQANAIGDLQRTSGSYANQQRQLEADQENLNIQLGQIFLPIMQGVVEGFSDAIKWISSAIKVWQDLAIQIGLTKDKMVDYYDAQGKLKEGDARARLEQLSKEIYIVGSNLEYAQREMEKTHGVTMNRFAPGFTGAAGEIYRLTEKLKDLKKEQIDLQSVLSKPIVLPTGGEFTPGSTDKEIKDAKDREKDLADYKFESGRTSLTNYLEFLDQRIAAEKEGTLEYFQLIDAKAAAEKDWNDKIMEQVKDQEKAKKDQIKEIIKSDQDKADYEYESGRMSLENYHIELNDRITAAAMAYGIDSMQYMQAVDLKKKVDEEYASKRKKLDLEGTKTFLTGLVQISTMFGNASEDMFNINKALAIASALVNTYQAASKALTEYAPPFSFIMAAVQVATGLGYVAQISREKYKKPKATAHALGGIVDERTLSILGEDGPEVIAPKKTFIDVTNELINKGQIGADNKMVIKKLTQVGDAINNLKITTRIDAEDLAIITEMGADRLSYREY